MTAASLALFLAGGCAADTARFDTARVPSVVITTTSTPTTTTRPRASRSQVAPRVVPPVPAISSDRAAWEKLIWELWGPSAVTAFRVVGCESRWNPHAVNRRSGAAGLFQIYPAQPNSLDPIANIHQAYKKWLAGGWRPWVSSRGCWAA